MREACNSGKIRGRAGGQETEGKRKKKEKEKGSSKQSGRIKLVIVDRTECTSLDVTMINDAH